MLATILTLLSCLMPQAASAAAPVQDPVVERALAKAREAWKAGDWASGIAWLEPVRSKLGDQPEARSLLGGLYFRRGWDRYEARKPRQARRLFEQAAQWRPEEPAVHYSLGRLRLELGDARRAEESLEKALELDGRHVASLLLLGKLRFEAGRFDEARVPLLRAKAIEPDNADLVLLLAKVDKDGEVEKGFAGLTSRNFELRFEGNRNELKKFDDKLLAFLEGCHAELRAVLGEAPRRRIPVVVYSDKQFARLTGVADWMGAFYDGKVRLPMASYLRERTKVEQHLRHEVAHAFLTDRVRRASPWLQEGFAQWFEGRRADGVKALIRAKGLNSADELRERFTEVDDEAEVTRRYASSLVLFSALVASKDRAGLRRLVDLLADGKPEDEALEAVFGADLAGLLETLQ
ncbi:MAG: tetratricopeptide repeat protein [Planctomycetota bacterium]